MVQFRTAGWFERPGIGWEAAVPLDQDTQDFSHLLRSRVLIDGNSYTCIAVNCFDHDPPWKKGERIGILVKQRITTVGNELADCVSR